MMMMMMMMMIMMRVLLSIKSLRCSLFQSRPAPILDHTVRTTGETAANDVNYDHVRKR